MIFISLQNSNITLVEVGRPVIEFCGDVIKFIHQWNHMNTHTQTQPPHPHTHTHTGNKSQKNHNMSIYHYQYILYRYQYIYIYISTYHINSSITFMW